MAGAKGWWDNPLAGRLERDYAQQPHAATRVRHEIAAATAAAARLLGTPGLGDIAVVDTSCASDVIAALAPLMLAERDLASLLFNERAPDGIEVLDKDQATSLLQAALDYSAWMGTIWSRCPLRDAYACDMDGLVSAEHFDQGTPLKQQRAAIRLAYSLAHARWRRRAIAPIDEAHRTAMLEFLRVMSTLLARVQLGQISDLERVKLDDPPPAFISFRY